MTGPLPPEVSLVHGRAPQHPGEAVAGSTAAALLGFADGAGPVYTRDQTIPVVGTVRFTGALSRFDDSVLIVTDGTAVQHDESHNLRFLWIVASEAQRVEEISQWASSILLAAHPEQVTIEQPDDAAALRDVISGRLGTASRQLMASILAVGILVIAVTQAATVSTMRRDYGRRRALGASRSAIVASVMIQGGVTALAGALVGTITGLVVVWSTMNSLPSAGFVLSLFTLSIVGALLGSIPPALIAATRDPLRILRVP
jgi:putative ABC transport system permease protein